MTCSSTLTSLQGIRRVSRTPVAPSAQREDSAVCVVNHATSLPGLASVRIGGRFAWFCPVAKAKKHCTCRQYNQCDTRTDRHRVTPSLEGVPDCDHNALIPCPPEPSASTRE